MTFFFKMKLSVNIQVIETPKASILMAPDDLQEHSGWKEKAPSGQLTLYFTRRRVRDS